MKTSLTLLRCVIALSAAFAFCSVAPAAQIQWSGGGANQNWSTAGGGGNWSGSAEPGASDTAYFTNSATAGDAVTVNNVVDGSVSIANLTYSQANGGFHNTVINNGVTLTVSNNAAANLLLVGTETDAGGAAALTNTISGAGGTLVLNNTNTASTMIIRQGSAAASGTYFSTLDLSGLDNFNATVGQLLIAVKTTPPNIDHAGGSLILAKTNLIQATSQNVTTVAGASGAIEIYDSASNTGGAANSKGIMMLGITNGIYADVLTVGRSKSAPGTMMIFNPAFSVNNPSAYFRGYSSNRVSQILVADDSGVSSTAVCTAAVDLSGGTVDAMIDALFVGKGANGSSGPVTGTFTMGSGKIDVNTVEVGFQKNAAATGIAKGTLNVTSGTLRVNTSLDLGHFLSGAITVANGALNITNGTVNAASITHGGGTSSIIVVGGAITMTNASGSVGTSVAPIGSITVSNSTWNLAVASVGVAPVNTAALTINTDTTNLINIKSLPLITSVPTTLPVIQSTAVIAGTFDFGLGTLPSGYAGSISVSGDGKAVNLVVTTAPIVQSVWTGADIAAHGITNWTDGLNWSTGVAPTTGGSVFFNTAASRGSSALSSPGSGTLVPANINNIVNANITIGALTYTNVSGTYENTFVSNNVALNVVGGGLTVGSSAADYGDTTGNVTVTGNTGALNVTNSVIYVGLGDSAGSAAKASLDMSGLGTLNTKVLNLLVGVGGYGGGSTTVSNAAGIVYLAQTNNITATSSAPGNSDSVSVALEVGDADANTPAIPSSLYLGRTNAIFADNISVARQLASGGIFFNPAFAGSSAYFRGASASAVNVWSIGDGVANTLDVTGSGTNDFTGGTIDVLVNTMNIAKASTGVSASGNNTTVTGTLTFNAGTINVNTLDVANSPGDSNGNVNNIGVGTVNVNGNLRHIHSQAHKSSCGT